MIPTTFPQANRVLKGPPGSDVGDLPTFTDGTHCVSCWKASWRERLVFMLTGRTWLWIYSGWTQPPVSVQVDQPSFATPIQDEIDRIEELSAKDIRALVGAAVKRDARAERSAK